jgi:hypothetical protein
MKKSFLLLSPILLFCKPVKVDEILTQKNDFKLDSSIVYSNINRKKGATSTIQYQTQNGDFVVIPTFFGDIQSSQDYLNYAVTLRYGFTNDIELYSTLNFYTSDTHFGTEGVFDTNSQKGFSSFSIGATYQVKKEDTYPSLLMGLSSKVIERTRFSSGYKSIFFKGYNLFATSYYSVDPVVFLLKSTYALSLKKEYEKSSIDNSEVFILSPQIYFAVNPYTSLNWGVKYSYHGKSREDKKVISGNGSDVAYLFGVSYEINSKTILNMDVDYSSGINSTQNNISFGLSYNF